MAKRIEFNYNDEHYTLEFTRAVVKRMEDGGFRMRELRDKPVTLLPILFEGAFQAHHKRLKTELVEEIYKEMKDKGGLMEKLIEMYSEPVDTLFEEPSPSEKNVQWEASF